MLFLQAEAFIFSLIVHLTHQTPLFPVIDLDGLHFCLEYAIILFSILVRAVSKW